MTKENKTEAFQDQFEAMYLGTLSEEETRALTQALASNRELQQEYNDFVGMMQMLEEGQRLPSQHTDLLPRIQKRIHIESQGKYFKQRAERQSKGKKWQGKQGQLRWLFTIAIFILLLIILALGWIHILDLTKEVQHK